MTASLIRAWNAHLNFLILKSCPTPGAMPSVTQETPPPVHSAKKRRRDDNIDSITTTTTTTAAATIDHSSTTLSYPLYGISASSKLSPITHSLLLRSSPTLHAHSQRSLFDGADTPHYHHVQALRKVMPLPAVKRIRTVDVKEDELRQISTASSQTKSDSPISQDHDRPTSVPGATATSTTTNTATSAPMNRCHICSRKPSKKSDLDSFADCEGCRQRTCFICIRQCLDWRPPSFSDEMTGCDRQQSRASLGAMSTDSFTMQDATADGDASEDHGYGPSPEGGEDSASKYQQLKDSGCWPAKGVHRQMVCSKCCVETGKDGDVVCLGCLPFVG